MHEGASNSMALKGALDPSHASRKGLRARGMCAACTNRLRPLYLEILDPPFIISIVLYTMRQTNFPIELNLFLPGPGSIECTANRPVF